MKSLKAANMANIWNFLEVNKAGKKGYHDDLKKIYYDHERGQFVATQGYSLAIFPQRMERFTRSGYVVGGSTYTCTMMDDKASYPDYMQVIPDSLLQGVTVSIPAWIGKMKTKDDCYIDFRLVKSDNPAIADQFTLGVDCSGESKCAFRVNAGYLAPLAGEEVQFLYSGSDEKPSIFEVELYENLVLNKVRLVVVPIRQNFKKGSI